MGIRRRLDRLEAHAPAARGEEEVSRRACELLSTEDLTTLAETLRRLDELDGGNDSWDEAAWDKLTEEERAAFEAAYARYEELVEEAGAGW